MNFLACLLLSVVLLLGFGFHILCLYSRPFFNWWQIRIYAFGSTFRANSILEYTYIYLNSTLFLLKGLSNENLPRNLCNFYNWRNIPRKHLDRNYSYSNICRKVLVPETMEINGWSLMLNVSKHTFKQGLSFSASGLRGILKQKCVIK